MLICSHVIINRGYNCLDLTAQFAVIANLKDKNSAIAQFAEQQERCNNSIIMTLKTISSRVMNNKV